MHSTPHVSVVLDSLVYKHPCKGCSAFPHSNVHLEGRGRKGGEEEGSGGMKGKEGRDGGKGGEEEGRLIR